MPAMRRGYRLSARGPAGIAGERLGREYMAGAPSPRAFPPAIRGRQPGRRDGSNAASAARHGMAAPSTGPPTGGAQLGHPHRGERHMGLTPAPSESATG